MKCEWNEGKSGVRTAKRIGVQEKYRQSRQLNDAVRSRGGKSSCLWSQAWSIICGKNFWDLPQWPIPTQGLTLCERLMVEKSETFCEAVSLHLLDAVVIASPWRRWYLLEADTYTATSRHPINSPRSAGYFSIRLLRQKIPPNEVPMKPKEAQSTAKLPRTTRSVSAPAICNSSTHQFWVHHTDSHL